MPQHTEPISKDWEIYLCWALKEISFRSLDINNTEFPELVQKNHQIIIKSNINNEHYRKGKVWSLGFLYYFKCPVSTKNYETCKGKPMVRTQEAASSEVFLRKLKVNLLDKDAKSAILNMFRELKESIRMVLN